MDKKSVKSSKPTRTSSVYGTRPKTTTQYSHIKATVDSGHSISKIEFLSNRASSKRKDELFLRIRSSTLSDLLASSELKENIYNFKTIETPLSSPQKDKNRKTLSLAPSILSITNPKTVKIPEDANFVVIDLRSYEEYVAGHIKNSILFPAINISRDRIHPILLKMKNQEGKLIILYAADDKSGVDAAQQFCQRNYLNVHLLTGGFGEFARIGPQFIEGFFYGGNPTIPMTPQARLRS